MAQGQESKSFWHTLPGILTGIAAVISAIVGLLIYLNNRPVEQNLHSQKPNDPTHNINGDWNFIWHSDITDITLKGVLNLHSDKNQDNNSITGHIQTYNTDWNNFSGDIKGRFENNQLKIYRETGVQNVVQYYDLTYYSDYKMLGTFHNSSNNPTYKDNGSFEITK